MKHKEAVIIGAGPAGLKAAKSLCEAGVQVTIIDRNQDLGGQLTKQTHKFFGSEKQYASIRGIEILKILLNDLKQYQGQCEILNETSVVGLYHDKVIACVKGDQYFKIQAKSIIVATGASEKSIPFENNDLPGVYAAGAVQTLMNQYGVKPGDKVLMVGSGNIGLIVSYQLLQAGVEVVKLVEAAPTISGYLVHASKIQRLGVDILTQTSIKRAIGKDQVEQVELWDLDETWQGIEGSEQTLDVDTVCISVGLAPLTELLMQMGAEVSYIRELGGNVPKIDHRYQTTVQGVYACGDVCGIEEASSAMVEGALSGLYAALDLGYSVADKNARIKALKEELKFLRSGPHAAKIRSGYSKLGVMI